MSSFAYLKEYDSITTIDEIDSHGDQRSHFDALSIRDTLGPLKVQDDITAKISIKSKRFVKG